MCSLAHAELRGASLILSMPTEDVSRQWSVAASTKHQRISVHPCPPITFTHLRPGPRSKFLAEGKTRDNLLAVVVSWALIWVDINQKKKTRQVEDACNTHFGILLGKFL